MCKAFLDATTKLLYITVHMELQLSLFYCSSLCSDITMKCSTKEFKYLCNDEAHSRLILLTQ